MFGLSGFISFLRDQFRAGALHFVKDPQSDDAQPIRDLVEAPTKAQISRLGRSALMYGSTILISLGTLSWGGRYFFPGALPLRWHPGCVRHPYERTLTEQTTAFDAAMGARHPPLCRTGRPPHRLAQLSVVRGRVGRAHALRRATTASLILPLRHSYVDHRRRRLTSQVRTTRRAGRSGSPTGTGSVVSRASSAAAPRPRHRRQPPTSRSTDRSRACRPTTTSSPAAIVRSSSTSTLTARRSRRTPTPTTTGGRSSTSHRIGSSASSPASTSSGSSSSATSSSWPRSSVRTNGHWASLTSYSPPRSLLHHRVDVRGRGRRRRLRVRARPHPLRLHTHPRRSRAPEPACAGPRALVVGRRPGQHRRH